VRVRLRALPLLLALTAGDYALWDWSIANSHDIVSLISGLTLLPLAAMSLGMLAVAGARLLRFVLGGTTSTPPLQAGGQAESNRTAHPRDAPEEDSSGRLAA
jgi:hypothetical protein